MEISLLKGIEEYRDIIEMLPSKEKYDLQEGLKELKNIGVEEYGRRIIWEDGKSAIITTCHRWIDIFNSKQIQNYMVEHTSEEIHKVNANNIALITRSSDKIYNEYLRMLDFLGLNNSVVKYYFYKDRIEVSYFIAHYKDSFSRDLFLNKMMILEKSEEKFLTTFRTIASSRSFMSKKEKVVNPLVVSKIISNSKKTNNTNNNSQELADILSYRELSCLALLRFECTNQFLARWLKVSESAIKQDINNIKIKLNIESREDLINLSQQPQIRRLSKLIGII